MVGIKDSYQSGNGAPTCVCILSIVKARNTKPPYFVKIMKVCAGGPLIHLPLNNKKKR